MPVHTRPPEKLAKALHQVAHGLGVDRKTVHRQLPRSGATFSSVLNAIRVRLSQQHLGNQSRSLTQVAELLGFSAPSAYSRWFREEFGTSPTTWRAARRDEST
ncbi:helix-turn-helix domain-containing protein [Streptomyces sp. NPDC052000]|uniref:helix-turn-helix domain-containing protein n=1 Tax=Streptomyces sp. NPDC052000 TaxID=3155676 RepID=UPI00344EC209